MFLAFFPVFPCVFVLYLLLRARIFYSRVEFYAIFAGPTTAQSAAPDSKTKDHWLHCYFNSKFDGTPSNVVRPNLHLVIALDVSPSMTDPFVGEERKSKIQVAQQSLLAVLR